MRPAGVAVAFTLMGLTVGSSSAVASEDWSAHSPQQQAIVKLIGLDGGPPRSGAPVRIDSYISLRDAGSYKVASQPQAMATIQIAMPPLAQIKAASYCPLWSTDKPWDFARTCSGSKVLEGWALVAGLGTTALARLSSASGGTSAPIGSANYADAPADCLGSDATQYSRTYEGSISSSDPLAGLPCTPAGYIWVHLSGYAGNGNGYIDRQTGGIYDKGDIGKAVLTKSDGSLFSAGDLYPATVQAGVLAGQGLEAGQPLTANQTRGLRSAYSRLLTETRSITLAGDNGVAALSFGGTVAFGLAGGATLSFNLPAFNDRGLRGYLPLNTDAVDIRFVTGSAAQLRAGKCTAGKYHVITKFTYSPFPAGYDFNPTHYTDKTVDYQGTCTN